MTLYNSYLLPRPAVSLCVVFVCVLAVSANSQLTVRPAFCGDDIETRVAVIIGTEPLRDTQQVRRDAPPDAAQAYGTMSSSAGTQEGEPHARAAVAADDDPRTPLLSGN